MRIVLIVNNLNPKIYLTREINWKKTVESFQNFPIFETLNLNECNNFNNFSACFKTPGSMFCNHCVGN